MRMVMKIKPRLDERFTRLAEARKRLPKSSGRRHEKMMPDEEIVSKLGVIQIKSLTYER